MKKYFKNSYFLFCLLYIVSLSVACLEAAVESEENNSRRSSFREARPYSQNESILEEEGLEEGEEEREDLEECICLFEEVLLTITITQKSSYRRTSSRYKNYLHFTKIHNHSPPFHN